VRSHRNEHTNISEHSQDATEPSRGSFQFSNADSVVAQAQQNGQIMRGHNCVWYSQLPSWVSSGSWTAATLQDVMQTHCTTVMSRYKGQM
jgi:endo-1,4-beta-xylanase